MSGRNAKLCRRIASAESKQKWGGPFQEVEDAAVARRIFRRLSQREKARARAEYGRRTS